MAKKGESAKRWRTIAILAIGIAIGTTMTATPVYSHVGGTVGHLWKKHIRPKADARYYTKAQADDRYAPMGSATSGDAETLDGLDSTEFIRAGSAAGGDLNGSYPNPTVGPNAIGGAEIDESSLGTVPTAGAVNGQSAMTFNYNVDRDSARRDVFTFGGLRLAASCTVLNDLTVSAFTDANNSYIRTNIAGAPASVDWDVGEDLGGGSGTGIWFSSSEDKAGTIVYRRGGTTSNTNPEVVSVTIAWDFTSGGNDCQMSGTVVGH